MNTEKMIELENKATNLTERLIDIFRPMIYLVIYKYLMDEYQMENQR